MVLYIIAAVLTIIGCALVVIGVRKGRLKSEIASTHTSSIDSIRSMDHVELKGVVSCDHPLEAPGYEPPCVYYKYSIKRRERRNSSDGKTTYQWKTIDSGSNRTPFTLTDSTGSVRIDPADADLDAPKVAERYIEPGEKVAEMPEGALKTVLTAASALGMGEREKIEVRALPITCSLYILGDVQTGGDGALTIAKGDGRFFISTKSEEQLERGFSRELIAYQVVAFIAFFIAIGIVIYGSR